MSHSGSACYSLHYFSVFCVSLKSSQLPLFVLQSVLYLVKCLLCWCCCSVAAEKPFFLSRASLPRFIYVNFYNILTKITIEKISANLSPLELGAARCQLDTNPSSKVFIIPQHRPRQSNLTCEARERRNSNNVRLKQSNSVPLVSCRRVAVCGSDVPVARS